MIGEDHPSFIPPKHDFIIWRYMDLKKFESLLKEQSLFFCRSDVFPDPYEGAIPKREVKYRPKEDQKLANYFGGSLTEKELRDRSNTMSDLHKRFRRSVLVNCWHLNKNESDAMWKLYLNPHNNGVLVRSDVKRLKKSLSNCAEVIDISQVRYLDYDKDIWHHEIDYPQLTYNFITPFVHKRKEFVHEKELRLIYQVSEAVNNDNYWKLQPNENGCFINIDLELLIDKIILPPNADGLIMKKVDSLMKKYNINKTVISSNMDNKPTF